MSADHSHEEVVEVLGKRPMSPDDPRARVPAFAPGRTVLKAGYRHQRGAMRLQCDIEVDRDVEVPLRDGTSIYVDIFRPVNGMDLASLVAWSPYGKQVGGFVLDDFPFRAGVPKQAVSELQKIEGPDPAYWCARGYAVVNPDPRGIGRSGGNMAFWGTGEGRDGADLIEWIAQQPWSSGKVGLTGNSWLGLSQWFIAAERPGHLAAIAPWEGAGDYYREILARGGIPDPGFTSWVLDKLSGQGMLEDVPEMLAKYPLMNAYWRDKAAQFEKIDVPAYVVASWSSPLHVPGTFDGYRRIQSKDKWLRVHNSMEWPDYYDPTNLEELRRFFDRYLRGVDNGWEATPKVRVSILDPGGVDEVNKVISGWPPKVSHTTLYLDAADGSLRREPPAKDAVMRYNSTDQRGRAVFEFHVTEDVDLLGYAALKLWVSADPARDMDLFVQITKVSSRGRTQFSHTVPLRNPLVRAVAKLAYRAGSKQLGLAFYRGPTGRLRVSHRQTDPVRSSPSEPYLTHSRELPLAAGETVPVDIPLWPAGMRWHVGDVLRLTVAGHDLAPVMMDRRQQPPILINEGDHVIHTGPDHPSHLLVPLCSPHGRL